jgi:hypothetical protein
MKPIAAEDRAEVLAACDASEGTRVVEARFNVSESWVRRIKQRRRETGQLAAQTIVGFNVATAHEPWKGLLAPNRIPEATRLQCGHGS